MNNIYVETMPSACEECSCCYYDDYAECYRCPLLLDNEINIYDKDSDCPLKPLSDRLAEERKKVCEQIYQLFTNGRMWLTMKDWWLNNGTCIELKQVLDAVETETPNQEIIKKFSKDREYYALLDNIREQHFLVLNKNELDQIERGK